MDYNINRLKKDYNLFLKAFQSSNDKISFSHTLLQQDLINPNILHELCLNSNIDIKIEISEKENLLPKTILLLSKINNKEIQNNLIDNPNTPELALKNLVLIIDSNNEEFLGEIIEHPNISTEILDYLSDNKNENIREMVAEHPKTSKRAIKKLLNDKKSLKVKRAAQHNTEENNNISIFQFLFKENVIEDNDSIYHITYFNRLSKILDWGLMKNMKSSIGASAYDEHRKKGIFFTDKSGIHYWYNKATDWAEHNSDDSKNEGFVPVVLKLDDREPKEIDELGSKDSNSDSWIINQNIKSENLLIWNGYEWIEFERYEEIDLDLAFEDEYYFKSLRSNQLANIL